VPGDAAAVLRRERGIAEIVLNRPAQLIAMDVALVHDLAAAVEALGADPDGSTWSCCAGRAACTAPPST
jgi:enoyl-CoA hydratase/carnithine racemase